MLTKEQILRKMQGFECPQYLMESCWQPIYDQCVAAIDLAAENELLKAKLDTLTAISERDDRCYVQLKAKLDDLRNLATEETYGTANMSWAKAMQAVLAIIEKDGDDT